jgi:hypothetical protein
LESSQEGFGCTEPVVLQVVEVLPGEDAAAVEVIKVQPAMVVMCMHGHVVE